MADPIVPSEGTYLGRVKLPGQSLPRVVTLRGGEVIDITAKAAPTVRDIAEMDDPAGYVAGVEGKSLGGLDALLASSAAGTRSEGKPVLLSPIDLQAVKAAGVTFVARTGETLAALQTLQDHH